MAVDERVERALYMAAVYPHATAVAVAKAAFAVADADHAKRVAALVEAGDLLATWAPRPGDALANWRRAVEAAQ